ncbi:hypothetical protein BAE44_0001512, partial [Dichanthelium oligosanthes]
LLLLLLAAAATDAAATPVAPAAGTAACHNDLVALRSTCYQYVQDDGPRVHPSPHCCATVRGIANATCVCDYFSSLDYGVIGSYMLNFSLLTSNIWMLVRNIKYSLIIKLIVQMKTKRRDEFIKTN